MIGDKISSYSVIESTKIGSAEFVVEENSGNSITPYGTWQANMKNDPHSYFWVIILAPRRKLWRTT